MGKMIDSDAIDDVVQKLNENGWEITRDEYKRISNVLFEFPTIEERKNGRWIDNRCSCCDNKALLQRCYDMDGTWLEYDLSNYCPNCGAVMKGADECGN